jgi:3-dehydroquinate synthase
MLCNDLHSALKPLLARYEQVCIVRSEGVKELKSEGVKELVLRTSEQTKSIETVTQIWDFLFAQEMTRRGLLIAIGGGVLTDLAGFAAATYKRGLDYVTVPTTLLSMVDAASGGKTGFNYHGLKNSIGVFAPPVETLIWPGWLQTLPAEQVLSGFGEMLKTGLIESTDRLWDRLLQYDLDTMPIETLTPLIDSCVRAKDKIVAADPHETGLRKVLNFGHTFGHALEEISLGTMPHGYAVVYGLIAELYLSVTKLGCPKEPLQQLTQLMLHYYGKPQCKCSDRAQLIALMQQDKKNEHAAEINCTLIQHIGSPVINQVITPAEADEALEYLFSL